jgi:DNA processing protein
MQYANALNSICGLGHKKLNQLMDYFCTAEDAWKATLSDLEAAGIGSLIANRIVLERSKMDPAVLWQQLAEENIIAVDKFDARYPTFLKQIPDHPYLIYMKGNLDCLNLPLIAIVGSRKLTTYGNQVARAFARELAINGICVVSGLAFGVDACAHEGALEANGKTIAVLGNSLDDQSIAPRSNFQLAQRILANDGLLISEFPLRTTASPGTFPARNRIMAGISLGTVVIEAALKSGSLITARLALDYNREVFAIPGSIFSPQSEGNHDLIINSGVKLVTSVKDILEELDMHLKENSPAKSMDIALSKEEKAVFELLSHESVHIDRISKLSKLKTSSVSSVLAILEINGLVKNIGGQNYIRI